MNAAKVAKLAANKYNGSDAAPITLQCCVKSMNATCSIRVIVIDINGFLVAISEEKHLEKIQGEMGP